MTQIFNPVTYEWESEVLEIIIPGEPIAQQRHRDKKGGRGKYDPSKAMKITCGHIVKSQINGHTPFKTPLHVDLFFYRSRPKSHYGTGKNSGKLKPSAPEWPTTTPDVDNYEKFIFDALNGITWKDDSFIVSTKSIKAYTENPKTIIKIMEL